MADFFPTDVSFRLDGSRAEATQHIGVARALFFKAMLLADRSDGKPVQISQRLGETGYVTATILGDIKIIDMYLPPTPTSRRSEEIPQPEVEIPPPGGGGLYMLTGIARGPTTVQDEDDNNLLRDFSPTQATAKAYGLNYAYEDNRKLGDNEPFLKQYRASMFSGAMKRIVQAIFGLGRISDDSYYLTEPTETTRNIEQLYASSSSQTHGIYKAAEKNHWLIEISVTRGVLAMPLPLIKSTASPSYRKRLADIGDAGGLAVVDEFGGLPSGETFPTGTDLADAIDDGKVLRLLEAADLSPFYGNTDGETHASFFSWAFAGSGYRADNVRYNYRKRDDDPKYSLNSEHWSIALDLSPYNLSPPPGNPVGTGSAVLRMLHDGRISKDCARNFWVSTSATERVSTPLASYAALDIMDLHPRGGELRRSYSSEKWGAVIYVFFRGNQVERVKYVPPYVWENWSRSRPAIHSIDPINGGKVYAPERSSGTVVSPGAIISDSIDMRALYISDGPYAISSGPLIPELILGPGSGPFGFYLPGEPPHWIPNPDLGDILAGPVFTFSEGIGDYGGRENCIPELFGVVPGLCREGFASGLFKYEMPGKPSEMSGRMVFCDISGVRGVVCQQGWLAPPNYLYPWYFGAVVNAGPNEAYNMTLGFYKQSAALGLPAASPGFTGRNLLPNTNSPTPLTVEKTHFIGGY